MDKPTLAAKLSQAFDLAQQNHVVPSGNAGKVAVEWFHSRFGTLDELQMLFTIVWLLDEIEGATPNKPKALIPGICVQCGKTHNRVGAYCLDCIGK